jgi:gas vesicle structural protein
VTSSSNPSEKLMSQQQSYRPILSIFDLLDRVLDKGLVIDANISVSLVGIEILVVRARIVVAGVDTFLRYAAALGLAGPPALVAAQTTSAGK